MGREIGEKWNHLPSEYRVSMGDDANVLKLMVAMAKTPINLPRIHLIVNKRYFTVAYP